MIAMWVSYRNVLRYVQILAYAVSNLYEGRKCIAIGFIRGNRDDRLFSAILGVIFIMGRYHCYTIVI